MAVETIGEAYSLGWAVRAYCGRGKRGLGMKSVRECTASVDLNLKTLVWTRGAAFPLSDLASRLKCPECEQRMVRVMFEPPPSPRREPKRA